MYVHVYVYKCSKTPSPKVSNLFGQGVIAGCPSIHKYTNSAYKSAYNFTFPSINNGFVKQIYRHTMKILCKQ